MCEAYVANLRASLRRTLPRVGPVTEDMILSTTATRLFKLRHCTEPEAGCRCASTSPCPAVLKRLTSFFPSGKGVTLLRRPTSPTATALSYTQESRLGEIAASIVERVSRNELLLAAGAETKSPRPCEQVQFDEFNLGLVEMTALSRANLVFFAPCATRVANCTCATASCSDPCAVVQERVAASPLNVHRTSTKCASRTDIGRALCTGAFHPVSCGTGSIPRCTCKSSSPLTPCPLWIDAALECLEAIPVEGDYQLAGDGEAPVAGPSHAATAGVLTSTLPILASGASALTSSSPGADHLGLPEHFTVAALTPGCAIPVYACSSPGASSSALALATPAGTSTSSDMPSLAPAAEESAMPDAAAASTDAADDLASHSCIGAPAMPHESGTPPPKTPLQEASVSSKATTEDRAASTASAGALGNCTKEQLLVDAHDETATQANASTVERNNVDTAEDTATRCRECLFMAVHDKVVALPNTRWADWSQQAELSAAECSSRLLLSIPEAGFCPSAPASRSTACAAFTNALIYAKRCAPGATDCCCAVSPASCPAGAARLALVLHYDAIIPTNFLEDITTMIALGVVATVRCRPRTQRVLCTCFASPPRTDLCPRWVHNVTKCLNAAREKQLTPSRKAARQREQRRSRASGSRPLPGTQAEITPATIGGGDCCQPPVTVTSPPPVFHCIASSPGSWADECEDAADTLPQLTGDQNPEAILRTPARATGSTPAAQQYAVCSPLIADPNMPKPASAAASLLRSRLNSSAGSHSVAPADGCE